MKFPVFSLYNPPDCLLQRGVNCEPVKYRPPDPPPVAATSSPETDKIDHLVQECYEAKALERRVHSSRTESGQSVEEQGRKEWSPSKGGLPVF
jgi:hypothetical protein